MSESTWKIPYKKPDSLALEQAGIPRLLAEVLASRGIVSPSRAHALYSAGPASLLDPLGILGMKEARDRVLRAIEQKECVTVYGDYDKVTARDANGNMTVGDTFTRSNRVFGVGCQLDL